jgi:hypothetical protein
LKLSKFFGISLIVLALAIAIVPFFTDCQSQGQALTTSTGKTIPMKCHWTGIAEIGVAIPLLGVGLMMALSRRKESVRNLSIIGIILGGLAVAFPSGLIGYCQTPTMICHTVMGPALIVLGSLAVIISLGALLMPGKGLD